MSVFKKGARRVPFLNTDMQQSALTSTST